MLEVSDGELAREYAEYNHQHFGDRLPKNVIVRYDSTLDEINFFGYTERMPDGRFRILIAPQMNRSPQVLGMTLLHEMVHVRLARKKLRDAHGPEFQREMQRLACRGAFRGLW